MRKNIPGLKPSELERLALLMEEMAEAQQVIGKILRHGFESCHPSGGPTNRELLSAEIGHVNFAIWLALTCGDILSDHMIDAHDSKYDNIWQYLHHNSKLQVAGNHD